jgi:predicted DNA-binding antitoxin AbrB/MazE fold protein
MQAVKSYRAYYDNGLFIPYEPVIIPKGCQVVVTVLDFIAEKLEVVFNFKAMIK